MSPRKEALFWLGLVVLLVGAYFLGTSSAR